MNLQEELASLSQQLTKEAPETVNSFADLVGALKKTGIASMGPQVGDSIQDFSLNNIYNQTELGDKIKNFTLANPWGEQISLDNLLTKGPVVINFYRGNWCPFCNIELRALEQIAPQIRELGGNLVAISLEKPDESLKTINRHHMQFIVLSDIKGRVAKQFKIIYRADKYNDLHSTFLEGTMAEHNGSKVAHYVIPATYVIDQSKTVRFKFADEDFTRRVNTDDILAAVKEI